VPTTIGPLGTLAELDLRKNSLTGTLPIEMNELTSLQVLNLHGNFITERDDGYVLKVRGSVN
jgi:Leucine-rich repeat (LRR) protein